MVTRTREKFVKLSGRVGIENGQVSEIARGHRSLLLGYPIRAAGLVVSMASTSAPSSPHLPSASNSPSVE